MLHLRLVFVCVNEKFLSWKSINQYRVYNFRAALIVALVISIVYAFSATTTEDDIEIKEKNAPKARRIDGSEFLNLMASIDWPITGSYT